MMQLSLALITIIIAVTPVLMTGVTWSQLGLLVLWLIWCNVLPGRAMWGWLKRGSDFETDGIQIIVTGVVFSIIAYVMGMLLHSFAFYLIITSSFALAGLYFILRGIKYWRRDYVTIKVNAGSSAAVLSPGELAFMSIILIGVNIILYYAFYQTCPLPGKEEIQYYIDIPWHLGNIASLSADWYPQDFRLAGFPLRYHFFAYAWLAALKKTCGLPAAIVLLRLFPAVFFNLLTICIWHTSRNLFSSRTAGIVLILTLIAGNFIPFKPYNLFLHDLMYSPTFLLAMVLSWSAGLEICRYLQKSGSEFKELLLPLLYMIALAGAKGPFLPVLLAGVMLVGISSKQLRFKAMILFASGTVVFGFFYWFMYRGGGAAAMTLTPGNIIYNTGIYKESLASWGDPSAVWALVLAIIIYLLYFWGFKLPGLIWGCRKLLQGNLVYGFFVGVALAGMAGGYLLQARDNSQYYFLFAGMIGLNMLGGAFISDLTGKVPGIKRKMVAIMLVILFIPSIMDSIYMVQKNINDGRARQELVHKSLSPGLYQGLVFLSRNSPSDSLVVGRRFSATAGRRVWFYYSAFSERRILLEGWEFMPPDRSNEVEKRYRDIDRLYRTTSTSTARKILLRYKIDYLIADHKYKSTLPHFPIKGLLDPVFSNDQVTIYRVRESRGRFF